MQNQPDENLYRTLGIQRSASSDEIRRAYRILARRYHPDLNPGDLAAAAKFSAIATAYETLSDEQRRQSYDAELNTAQQFSDAAKRSSAFFYQQHQQAAKQAGPRTASSGRTRAPIHDAAKTSASVKLSPRPKTHSQLWARMLSLGRGFLRTQRSLAVVEVSLSMREALLGGKKSVELADEHPKNNHHKKISLNIPPGSRNGSIMQLRSKKEQGEEILVIFRVTPHPFLSMEARGVVTELALTLTEAVQGATLIVPTFDEPVALKIPGFTSSGQEFRLKGKGIMHSNGVRGDLFFRAMIKLPDEASSRVQLSTTLEGKPKTEDEHVRSYLPKSLNELR